MAATARLEFRVDPVRRARIEQAAKIVRLPVSEFVRSSAEERADEVLRDYEQRTVVSPEFFEYLLDALDAPPERNEPLERAARRMRKHVVRD